MHEAYALFKPAFNDLLTIIFLSLISEVLKSNICEKSFIFIGHFIFLCWFF
jgi:hypothetical protein